MIQIKVLKTHINELEKVANNWLEEMQEADNSETRFVLHNLYPQLTDNLIGCIVVSYEIEPVSYIPKESKL